MLDCLSLSFSLSASLPPSCCVGLVGLSARAPRTSALLPLVTKKEKLRSEKCISTSAFLVYSYLSRKEIEVVLQFSPHSSNPRQNLRARSPSYLSRTSTVVKDFTESISHSALQKSEPQFLDKFLTLSLRERQFLSLFTKASLAPPPRAVRSQTVRAFPPRAASALALIPSKERKLSLSCLMRRFLSFGS